VRSGPPAKYGTNYSEARERKKLGKRILKAVQPQLEAALKAEADITNKPLNTLVKELEGMLEASLEMRQPTITISNEDVVPDDGQDIIMSDVVEGGHIIIANQHGLANLDVEDDNNGSKPDPNRDASGEITMEDIGAAGNIEVNTSDLADMENMEVQMLGGKNSSVILGQAVAEPKPEQMPNRVNDSGSPTSINGYAPPGQILHTGPLTPPQSNGSLGRGPTDTLNEGGIPWYLKGFELEGTTAVEEQWAGRDAVRLLSEELTDMDDEALRDLEFDVDDDTITASPVNNATTEIPSGATPTPSARKRSNPAKFRKGVRSSARRR
jgi:NuA3 HAT complex component NTO1